MSIQEQINNMDNFKENLTLKFHRNQELIENDQAVWEDFVQQHKGDTVSEDGCGIMDLPQDVCIMIDRMRRMAGRGEQPYKKWKILAATRVLDENNRRLHEMQENLMNETIEKLKK